MRDFFSAHIRNANTRPVHLKAIRQFSVLVLGLALWTACTTDAQEVHRASLQLTLSQVQDTARFRVELHNKGKLPLTLNLGFTTSGKQYPEAIHLLLTDAHGKTLLLEVLYHGVIGGTAGAHSSQNCH